MFRESSRIAKTVLFSALWFALRVPVDLLIIKCSVHDAALLIVALSVQVACSAIAVFLIYRVVAIEVRRPHKCPVCEGEGIRFYHPSFGKSSDQATTSPKCRSCNGSGVIWEEVRR